LCAVGDVRSTFTTCTLGMLFSAITVSIHRLSQSGSAAPFSTWTEPTRRPPSASSSAVSVR